MVLGKSDTMGGVGGSRRPWPPWARVAITLALLFHAGAIWAGAWAAPPASDLQRGIAGLFRGYHGLIDQGYSYRYYAPAPPPTPVVTATISFKDGRTETVRLPDRATRPRMLYQRELALANHLMSDVEEARGAKGDPSESLWARSYARHLGKTHPGATMVRLSSQLHMIPDPGRVAAEIRDGHPVDLDDEASYTVPERIGDYPCDAS